VPILPLFISESYQFLIAKYSVLKEAVDGLASIKIEWNLLKDKVPADISFLNLRILHGAPTFIMMAHLTFRLIK